MRHSVLHVMLVLVLVLAGCNGLLLGNEEPSVTPANVPTDAPTPTPVPKLAPGLTKHGVINPSVLVNAHASVLDNTSYTVHESRTVRYTNGTLYRRLTTNAEFAANGTRYFIVRNASGTAVRASGTEPPTLWSDGERVLVARTRNNSTSYFIPHRADRELASPQQVLSFNPTNNEDLFLIFNAVETRVIDREQGMEHRSIESRRPI